MDIIQCKVAPEDFTPGRKNEAISMLVIHTEQGTDAGTAAWFANPHAHASAHYSVSFEGRVRQFVQDQDTAWHSGNAHVNRCSLGIELEGFEERGRFPKPMIDALITLINERVALYSIKLDRTHIIGHCEVPDPLHPGQFGGANNHTDPGPLFPWPELCDRLGMVKRTTDAPAVASAAVAAAQTPTATASTPEASPEAAGPADMVCGRCGLYQAIMSAHGLDGHEMDVCGECAKLLGAFA